MAEIIDERMVQVAGARERHVDAPQQERQAFAEMAENDLQFGIGVEYPAEHHAHALRCRLDGVAPSPAEERWKLVAVLFVIRVDHRLRWTRWVHVDRHVEVLRALEQRPEGLLVEEKAVGQPVHHAAKKAKLGHGALEFVGGGLW